MTQWHPGNAPKMPRCTMEVLSTRLPRQYLASEKRFSQN
jgi:hypothetical protein